MREMFKTMAQRLSAGEELVLVTVVASSGATPRGAGARMLIGAGGRICGTIGGGAVEYRSEQIAAEVLRERKSGSRDFSLTKNDVQNLGMICGGDVKVYFRYIPARDGETLALAAEAESEAILKVQQATADALKLLNEAAPNSEVLQLKALEAFQKAADGRATKIIIPSEIQGLAGLCASAKTVFDSVTPNPAAPAPTQKAPTPKP